VAEAYICSFISNGFEAGENETGIHPEPPQSSSSSSSDDSDDDEAVAAANEENSSDAAAVPGEFGYEPPSYEPPSAEEEEEDSGDALEAQEKAEPEEVPDEGMPEVPETTPEAEAAAKNAARITELASQFASQDAQGAQQKQRLEPTPEPEAGSPEEPGADNSQIAVETSPPEPVVSGEASDGEAEPGAAAAGNGFSREFNSEINARPLSINPGIVMSPER